MGERGSVTIWGLGLALLLVAFSGIALDTWRLFSERQALAGLADSAAIAGATALDPEAFRTSGEVRLDPDAALARAQAYLAEHSFGRTSDYSATIVPTVGDITVILERDVELTLLTAFLEEDTIHFRIDAFATPGERAGP